MRRRFALPAAGAIIALVGWSGCGSRPAPEAVFAEGEGLRLRYDKAASQQAIAKYRQAQEEFERRGDRGSAARASQRIGTTYWQLGSVHDSLLAYQTALALVRDAADPILESEVRSDAGVAQAFAAESARGLTEAEQYCQAGLALARESRAQPSTAKALNCLGEVAYFNRRLDQALGFFRDAGQLWDKIGDPQGQAQTLLYQGHVYSELSRFDEASICLDRAHSLWTSVRDKREQAITLVAEARLHQRRGEYQEALNGFLKALAQIEPMGDAIWEASSVTGVATVYSQMGEESRALKYWERAFSLFETTGLKSASIDILISLGSAFLASGDDATALSRFERALVLAQELKSPLWESYALRYIGVVYLQRRSLGQARQFLERALDVQRSLGDRRLDAETRADLGEVHELLGEHTQAVALFEDAQGLSKATGDRFGEARALFGLGRAAIGLNHLDTARGYIERSLKVAESLRSEVQSQDLRASYLASVHEYYELHVEILMRLNDVRPRANLVAAAFEASERAHARSLLESLAHAGVDLRKAVEADLLKREEAVKRGFDDWAERQRRLDSTQARGAAEARAEEYRDLEDRYNQIEAEIRGRSPHYAALAQPEPLSLIAVQKDVLDADTLLLEYALGEQRSFLWAVSNRDQTSYVLAPRAEIERSAQRVYQLLTTRLTATGDPSERRQRIEQADVEYWKEAQRLSEMLLGPVAARIVGKRILVVTDGALQYLPFAALPIPGGLGEPVPMVVEHEIVNLPSASVLAVLRQEMKGRQPPTGAVAVLADPVFESDDPRLQSVSATDGRDKAPSPTDAVKAASAAVGTLFSSGFLRDGSVNVPRLASTRQEADAILATAADGATLRAIDFDASRATAMSPNLAHYRIVHFATHGVFNNDDPGLSGIILSLFDKRGQPQDGFLRLHDIYELQLPAELVVLSACNTALGKPVKGEGLVGIVRGFMYAGAKRVVASHWKVDDEATGALMGRFYVEMLKQNRSAAAALRQAQLAVREQQRWQSPFYWAAFVLQGEWK